MGRLALFSYQVILNVEKKLITKFQSNALTCLRWLHLMLVNWNLLADLLNIFEVFLPQLLLYPNPSHPLNREAGSLMMKDPKKYEQKVKGEHQALYHFFT